MWNIKRIFKNVLPLEKLKILKVKIIFIIMLQKYISENIKGIRKNSVNCINRYFVLCK